MTFINISSSSSSSSSGSGSSCNNLVLAAFLVFNLALVEPQGGGMATAEVAVEVLEGILFLQRLRALGNFTKGGLTEGGRTKEAAGTTHVSGTFRLGHHSLLIEDRHQP